MSKGYKDEACRCGHGHDASHEPDGTCLQPHCGCVNDGAGPRCTATPYNGFSPHCDKPAGHGGYHLHVGTNATQAWGFDFAPTA